MRPEIEVLRKLFIETAQGYSVDDIRYALWKVLARFGVQMPYPFPTAEGESLYYKLMSVVPVDYPKMGEGE